MVPFREAFLGSTLETMKTCSRRPAIASATTSSASPLPYISAVSMWVMPSSMPLRSAATASLRGPCSMYQVPWPMTGTSRRVAPNVCVRMMLSKGTFEEGGSGERARIRAIGCDHLYADGELVDVVRGHIDAGRTQECPETIEPRLTRRGEACGRGSGGR